VNFLNLLFAILSTQMQFRVSPNPNASQPGNPLLVVHPSDQHVTSGAWYLRPAAQLHLLEHVFHCNQTAPSLPQQAPTLPIQERKQKRAWEPVPVPEAEHLQAQDSAQESNCIPNIPLVWVPFVHTHNH
jgi:hypothetical protein